jgi:uncharacterized cupredoxin-like copper-binding protein
MRRLICAVVLGIPLARVAAQSSSPRAAEPVEIAVVGTDYAFLPLPATIAHGKTYFSFENRGKVRHEMSVTLLRPGVTVEQVVQAGNAAQRLYERIVGILIARPGESSGGQLFVDLQRDRTYLMICTLKDAGTGPPHVELGMVTSFVAR